MNNELLAEQLDHMSALQSWAPEIRNFVELNERPIEADKCDLVYEKPVFIMKIDASKVSSILHMFKTKRMTNRSKTPCSHEFFLLLFM